MPISIHAKELPLKEIFSTDFAFEIPRYQRPYAWKTEHAGELLSDILDVIDKEAGDPLQVRPYFLGSIVLIKSDDHPCAEVVDGQQRLTTLTILLAALREVVVPEVRDDVTDYIYQKSKPLTNTPAAYRVKLREKDEAFFRTYVQNEGGLSSLGALSQASLSDSQANVRDNALYLLRELRKLNADQCSRLLLYLINRCFLVTVSTPDFDAAYRIFSVLNTRGMQLSLTDLLKSDIIGAIPEEEQDHYTKIWEDTETAIGREGFQELFSHIRMIRRKAKASETALKEYQTYIKPSAQPRAFIDDTLQPYADAFAEIRNQSYASATGAEKINALFGWLNLIDNFDWMPPAIAFLANHHNDPVKLGRFFADLERLAAGLMIRRANVTSRLERYGRLLTEMDKGTDLFRDSSPLQLSPEEKSTIRATLDGNLYRQLFARYVLLRLDAALSSGGAHYDHKTISIEHVLPQNSRLGSQWEKWFQVPEERSDWVHRIANLTLLARRKNSEAQNYDFDKKKQKYFTTASGVTPFRLTTQVMNYDEWTPDILQARQTQHLDTLNRVWRL